jgi:hypothetical protein
LLIAFAVAFVAVVCVLSLAAGWGGSTRSLVLAGLGTVLGFLALGKVLSPQFLIWTLPLLALAVASRMWALAATLGSASVLTFIEFPRQYFGGLLEFKAFSVIPVSMLDALLITAMGLVLRALRRRGTGERKAADVKPQRPPGVPPVPLQMPRRAGSSRRDVRSHALRQQLPKRLTRWTLATCCVTDPGV